MQYFDYYSTMLDIKKSVSGGGDSDAGSNLPVKTVDTDVRQAQADALKPAVDKKSESLSDKRQRQKDSVVQENLDMILTGERPAVERDASFVVNEPDTGIGQIVSDNASDSGSVVDDMDGYISDARRSDVVYNILTSREQNKQENAIKIQNKSNDAESDIHDQIMSDKGEFDNPNVNKAGSESGSDSDPDDGMIPLDVEGSDLPGSESVTQNNDVNSVNDNQGLDVASNGSITKSYDNDHNTKYSFGDDKVVKDFKNDYGKRDDFEAKEVDPKLLAEQTRLKGNNHRRVSDNVSNSINSDLRSGVSTGASVSDDTGIVRNNNDSGVRNNNDSGVRNNNDSGVRNNNDSGVRNNNDSGVINNNDSRGSDVMTNRRTGIRPVISDTTGTSVIKKFPKYMAKYAKDLFPAAGNIDDAVTAYFYYHEGRPVDMPVSDEIKKIAESYVGEDFTMMDMRDDFLREISDLHRLIKSISRKVDILEMAMSYNVFDRMGFRHKRPETPGNIDFLEQGVTDVMNRLESQSDLYAAKESHRKGRAIH